MIKKINNKKIRVDEIFRLAPASKSRIGQTRLDKNERMPLPSKMYKHRFKTPAGHIAEEDYRWLIK